MATRVLTGEHDLGTYGVLGGEIHLYGQWVPDIDEPSEAADQLLQLAGYLEDTERPLLGAARIARSDTQKRFDTETDPDGTPWIELDPDYLEYKLSEGFPENILVRTDRMRRAAVSEGAWLVDNDTLFFDPSGLPFYAALHQSGVGEENVGVARDMRERQRAVSNREGTKGGKDVGMGIGRGNALPARPFIGLSDEAVNEIAYLFDLWFEESREIFVHPHTGTTQRWQFRGNVRLFGPKL